MIKYRIGFAIILLDGNAALRFSKIVMHLSTAYTPRRQF